MGWLDTMTPKPGGSRHCSDDYMYMVHGAYVVAEADDKTVYFSAKYSSKSIMAFLSPARKARTRQRCGATERCGEGNEAYDAVTDVQRQA